MQKILRYFIIILFVNRLFIIIVVIFIINLFFRGPLGRILFQSNWCHPLKIKVILQRLDKSCFLAKTDIKSAFRIISIHPAEYSLLGMKWDNMYYLDRCLVMGLSSSCAI